MIELKVNGQVYAAWKTAKVTRTWRAVAGGFTLELADRWRANEEPMPVGPCDPVEIWLDGEILITGILDADTISLGPNNHGFSVSGRCKTGQLEDCSAEFPGGTWKKADLVQIVKDICKPYGITVKPEAETGEPFKKFSLEPGETCLEAINRACSQRGVLCVSNKAGELHLISGEAAAAVDRLELGVNLKTISSTRNAQDRFSNYTVLPSMGSSAGSFSSPKNRTPGAGQAEDEGILKKLYRHLILVPGETAETQQMANFEAQLRAAKSQSISCMLPQIRQTNGDLWAEGLEVSLIAVPISNGGQWVISECSYSFGPGGTSVDLNLVRPDVFLQPPAKKKAKIKTKDNSKW